MSDIKDLLASARLPERSVQVCLRGDLAAEFEDLERQIAEARQTEVTGGTGDGATTQRMGSRPRSITLAEQQAKVRDEMAAAMLTVKVRALPRHRWQELAAKHPPRDGEDGDRALGVHLEPFAAEVLPLCIVDPALDPTDWARLQDVLSSGDFDRLFNAVWDVNRAGVDLPKSRLASLVMAEHAAASKPREPGE